MTIKEFSIKHEIPYSVVYNASYLVKNYTGNIRSKQYDEEDLRCAVETHMIHRIQRLEKSLDEAYGIIKQCKL